MKKDKLSNKEVKKKTKKELAGKFSNALQTAAGAFGNNQKKVDSLIDKTAKQLAKKISKFNTVGTETIATISDVPKASKAKKLQVEKVK